MSLGSVSDDLLGTFLTEAVREVLANEQRDAWLGWMIETGRTRYSVFFDPIPDEEGRRVLATYLGLSFWSAMPLPRLEFEVDPHAIPEAEERCPCRSGARYGECCAAGPPPAPEMFERGELWRTLVQGLSEAAFERLIAMDPVPPSALAPAGDRLTTSGRPTVAIDLIEPVLFRSAAQPPTADGAKAPETARTETAPIVARSADGWREDALRTLLRAYDAIGQGAESEATFEHLDSCLDDGLRAMLWWIQAVSLADRGDLERAREVLTKAWRLAPDSPSLAPIEIMLTLVLQGPEQARERARFLLARLRRAGFEDDEWSITFLRRASTDPLVAFAPQLGCSPEHAERLRRLVDSLDALPVECHSIDQSDERSKNFTRSWLVPPGGLDEIETRWSGLFPLEKPFGQALWPETTALSADQAWNESTAERWLSFLESNPEAFNSFEILDDLGLAIDELTASQQGFGSLHRSLIDPVLRRGRLLLEQSTRGTVDLYLPWATASNRSALRLLARAAVGAHDANPVAAASSIEEVLRLDADDPYGLRSRLADSYLRAQANEDLLELCARFPGDRRTELLYGKVLALFRLQRMDAAVEALEAAFAVQPDIARFLLDRDLGPPDPMTPRIEASAATHAWLYRRSAEDLWAETPGALSWLRGQHRRIGRRIEAEPDSTRKLQGMVAQAE